MKRGRLQSRPRFAVFAAVVLTAATLAAGCGSDDDGGSTDSQARDDYIAQADQICTDTGEQISAETVKRQIGSEGQTGRFVIDLYKEVTIPALDDMFAQIGKLTPPPGDEEQVQEILDAADDAIATAEDKPASLSQPVGVGKGNPFDEVNSLLQDYGFQVCGGGNA